MIKGSVITRYTSDIELHTSYYDNGNRWLERYINIKFYKLHREDGPAEITYEVSGEVTSKKWYIEGQLHREDGCAHMLRGFDAGTFISYYFLKDVNYSVGDFRLYCLASGNIKGLESTFSNNINIKNM